MFACVTIKKKKKDNIAISFWGFPHRFPCY